MKLSIQSLSHKYVMFVWHVEEQENMGPNIFHTNSNDYLQLNVTQRNSQYCDCLIGQPFWIVSNSIMEKCKEQQYNNK